MSGKNDVLEMLYRNRGSFISGEKLAEQLHVSRTAVWQAVNQLRKSDYQIEAVTNKGYRMPADTDLLSAMEIGSYLNGSASSLRTEVFKSVGSTNTLARVRATQNEPHGLCVIASEQKNGRGRLGRSFFSPSGSGLYMSVLVRPSIPSDKAILLTTAAAVAVAQAIDAVVNEYEGDYGQEQSSAGIKWVNDVFMGGKKVSGILTESSFNTELGNLEYAIVGIGINLMPPKDGFPNELDSIAGTVFKRYHSGARNRIAAEILNRFMSFYDALPENHFFDEYKKRLFILGKSISVVKNGVTIPAVAVDLDKELRLRVRYGNGDVESLFSGEISIRP